MQENEERSAVKDGEEKNTAVGVTELLASIRAALEEQAARFPAELKTEVAAYFQDEKGNVAEAFDAAKKTFEAWGELTLTAEPEGDDEEGESYTIPLMISVGRSGEVDGDEVETTYAELRAVVDEALAGMEEYGAAGYLREKNAEAERKYREELEKFNRSLRGMKKLVIGLSIAAAVVLVIMVLIRAAM